MFFVSVFILQAQMILEYNTNLSSGTTITLPLYGTVDVSVDWGDGNTEAFISPGNKSHTYAIEGIYTVEISGTLTHFGSNGISNNKFTQIIDFGDIGLTDLSYACSNAINLTHVPIQIPGEVTNLCGMFSHAESFNQDIGTWDVSNVTDMSSMFEYAELFNQDIGAWNVSNVNNMMKMFYHSLTFNQPIGDWNVGNVTNMSQMFLASEDFDQPIGNWDVGSVTEMQYMFCHTDLFNQNLNNWDVSGVTNMKAMFMETEVFNSKIQSWDVSNVTDMSQMFRTAYAFNQDITEWDVSSVTDMSQMFRTTFVFNQDIGGWDVGSVTNMSDMFFQAQSFNQDIGEWDVSNVTNMNAMFYNAYVFDQDIGGWGVSNVTSMGAMFLLSGLSVPNYDALLIGWAAQNLNSGLSFDGGDSQYSCAALEAHNILTGAPNNWNITDAGYVEDDIDPAITCHSNLNIIADNESQTYTVQGTELDPLFFDDNCEGAFITNNINNSNSLINSVFGLGTTSVHWTAEDANGNQNTCSFFVTIETYSEIEDPDKIILLSVYPNPATKKITIDCGSNFSANKCYKIKITNSITNTVYISPVNSQKITIDTSVWGEPGIYFVHLLDDQNNVIETNKLVIQ